MSNNPNFRRPPVNAHQAHLLNGQKPQQVQVAFREFESDLAHPTAFAVGPNMVTRGGLTKLQYVAAMVAQNDYYTPAQCAERAQAVLDACADLTEKRADAKAAGDDERPPAPETVVE